LLALLPFVRQYREHRTIKRRLRFGMFSGGS
jgi:hypothetical protein